mmetsp:Transcript_5025/g.19326  ORF Transcript_5025/g.19326 Transcript_5025/m.19326 type:complete len:157 (-) Transcript_5025:1807-2277(-)
MPFDPSAMSSSCVPCSRTIEPCAPPPPPANPAAASLLPSTTILLASRTVVNLCAMTMVVRCPPATECTNPSRASCTSISFSVSSAEVASSRINIAGLRSAARAMAMRCFCPPDSLEFFPPTMVLYPFGNDMMNSCAHAASAAATISSIEAFEPPIA